MPIQHKQSLDLTLVVLLLLGICYYVGRAEALPFGDALGFALSSIDTQPDLSTNATSHLLYQLLLYGLVQVLPLDLPTVLWLVSAAFALATIWQLDTIYKEYGLGSILRSGLALGLGLSFSFWRHAEIPEVYTCYWFCLVVQWRLLIWVARSATELVKDFWWPIIIASGWMGVTLLVHISHIILVPSGLLVIAIVSYQRFRAIKMVVVAVVVSLLACGLIGGLLILIPILTNNETVANAASKALFDGMHQGAVLSITLSTVPRGIALGASLYLYNFGLFGLLLLMLIVKLISGRGRKLGLSGFGDPILLGLLTYAGLSVLYIVRFSNLQVLPFYGPCYISLFMLFAFLASAEPTKVITGYLKRTLLPNTGSIWIALALAQPLLYGLMFWLTNIVVSQQQVPIQLASVKQFADLKAYKGGLAYYLLPWQPKVDALQVTKEIRNKPQPTMADSAIIQDMGYNWAQAQELVRRQDMKPSP